MKKRLTLSVILFILVSILILNGCKKSEETDEFTLSVAIDNGVSGAPGTGTLTYAKDDTVTYSYRLKDFYSDLLVTLDGVEVESNGTLTISGNHQLTATSTEVVAEFKLTVIHYSGTQGTPESGVYYYNTGDEVAYEFSLLENYEDLRVALDGVDVASSGTVTVSGDHNLSVYSKLQYNIAGSWEIAETYNDTSFFSVTLTFTGDMDSGTVTDSDGGTGTYTVDGTSVNFSLDFPEVSYEYTGNFVTRDTMSGYSVRITENGEKRESGTWNSARSTDTTGAARAYRNSSQTHKGQVQ
ncbi:MAG: hypothetical protein GY765_17955 [bacterium]|nr:hypothetical protein [bacterium]